MKHVLLFEVYIRMTYPTYYSFHLTCSFTFTYAFGDATPRNMCTKSTPIVSGEQGHCRMETALSVPSESVWLLLGVYSATRYLLEEVTCSQTSPFLIA